MTPRGAELTGVTVLIPGIYVLEVKLSNQELLHWT